MKLIHIIYGSNFEKKKNKIKLESVTFFMTLCYRPFHAAIRGRFYFILFLKKEDKIKNLSRSSCVWTGE
jgi:hypothetical protein